MSLFFLLPGREHGVGREFFICEVLHLLHQFVPDLYSVTLFLHTWSNTASQGSDVLIRFYLASFKLIYLPVVTLSDNDSKQIAVATSFRMSALLTLKIF